MVDKSLPHIRVEIEFQGERVSLHSTDFMDSIRFLLGCEKALRDKLGLKQDIDIQTRAFQKSNLDKLLELNKKMD